MVRIGRSLIAAIAVVSGVVVCAAPAAAAPAGLDASYGSGGVVQLAPPLPAGLFPARYPLAQAAFARDGSAYATEAVSTCESNSSPGPCKHEIRLFRYQKNGALDSGFGGSGSVTVPYGTERIAADAKGRVLVATRTETGGRIERLLPSGRRDRSFGRGGWVRLKGFKSLIEFLLPAGHGRVLLGVTEGLGGDPGASGKRLTLFRLLPNGRLDRSFARHGRGRYVLALPSLETRIAIGRRGSILLLGSPCCEGFRPIYRISRRGRLDAEFDAAARRALQRLNAFGPIEPTAIVPRPGGGVDLLGITGNVYADPQSARGFELRLAADGRLDRQFGQRGARSLPLPIAAASPGVGGATIAVAQVEETVTVLRLLAGGAPDPAFGGRSGVQVPLPGAGVTPQPLAGARVGLFGNGFRFCNEPTCVIAPYLARFIEASPSRRAAKKGGRK